MVNPLNGSHRYGSSLPKFCILKQMVHCPSPTPFCMGIVFFFLWHYYTYSNINIFNSNLNIKFNIKHMMHTKFVKWCSYKSILNKNELWSENKLQKVNFKVHALHSGVAGRIWKWNSLSLSLQSKMKSGFWTEMNSFRNESVLIFTGTGKEWYKLLFKFFNHPL